MRSSQQPRRFTVDRVSPDAFSGFTIPLFSQETNDFSTGRANRVAECRDDLARLPPSRRSHWLRRDDCYVTAIKLIPWNADYYVLTLLIGHYKKMWPSGSRDLSLRRQTFYWSFFKSSWVDKSDSKISYELHSTVCVLKNKSCTHIAASNCYCSQAAYIAYLKNWRKTGLNVSETPSKILLFWRIKVVDSYKRLSLLLGRSHSLPRLLKAISSEGTRHWKMLLFWRI